MPPDHKPSPRLRRAAVAERRKLEQQRERLSRRRDSLIERLHEVDLEIVGLDSQLELLERLGAMEDAPPARAETDVPSNGGRVLRGPAIRERAVILLAAHPTGSAPIHYKDWVSLLTNAGYVIAGRDEHAVFLSQLSRSPVVRRTTHPGTYEIDWEAPERLRRELLRLQNDLRSQPTPISAGAADLVAARDRRNRLTARISRTERALEEAVRVLDSTRRHGGSGEALTR
jgi:hypothetical protein